MKTDQTHDPFGSVGSSSEPETKTGLLPWLLENLQKEVDHWLRHILLLQGHHQPHASHRSPMPCWPRDQTNPKSHLASSNQSLPPPCVDYDVLVQNDALEDAASARRRGCSMQSSLHRSSADCWYWPGWISIPRH